MRIHEIIRESREENFKRWFGNSKVVDGAGRPLVVYHGLAGPVFSVFDQSFLGKNYNHPLSKVGFFFTDNFKAADDYAYQAEWNAFEKDGLDISGSVMSVFLSLKNPIEIDAAGGDGSPEWSVAIAKKIKDAKSSGHDGVILRNMADGSDATTQYIAFHPAQIKSATGNNGEFNPNNPDITKE